MSSYSSQKHLLKTYLKPLKQKLLLLAILLFTSIALQLIIPQITRHFIDTAQAGGAHRELTYAALCFISASILGQVFSVAAIYTSTDIGWRATNRLRSGLTLHCLELDMSFHNNRTPGEMIERIDGDVAALNNFFSQFVVQLLGSGLLLLGVLGILYYEDWRLGVLFTIFIVFVFMIMNRIRNIATPFWGESRQASAELYGYLEERLSGVEDIRANGAASYILHRFYHFARTFFFKHRTANFKAGVIGEVMPFLMTLGYITALALGVIFYQAETMTIGTIYLLMHYLQMIQWPMVMIRYQVDDFQRATASIARISELFQIQSHIKDGKERMTDLIPEYGAVAVACDNVSFRYGSGDMVLRNATFTIKPNKVLGLLGRTGSGKTTLSRLLFRLYDPVEGTIRLAGQDIKQIAVSDIRDRVGMVTQDVQLFDATIRDNLTFFDDQIPDDQILQGMASIGLEAWYNSLPDGLDTKLAADGNGLSAGEAQLLAFVRVFLKDPDLIILDEASSRLDPVTERLIEQAIDRLLHNRTGIIIAHRLSTIQRVDDIMILEAGCIIEHGAREQLAQDSESRFHGLLRTGMEDLLV